MKQKFTLFLIVCLFAGLQGFAQKQEWPRSPQGKANNSKIALQKQETALEKAKVMLSQNIKLCESIKQALPKNENLKKITEDWWEPDTITNLSLTAISSRKISEFNEKGLLTTEITQGSADAGATWSYVYKTSYHYDVQNNMNLRIKEVWNPENNDWLNYERSINTHDGSGNVLTTLIEYWNTEQATWRPDFRGTYTYDGQNRLTLEVIERDWDDIGWVYTGRDSYSYNNFDQILVHLTEIWDNEVWTNFSQTTNIYDNEGYILMEEILNWRGTEWGKYILGSYDYNEDHKLIQYISQQGNEDNEWEYFGRDTATYDERGNELIFLTQFYNPVLSTWENSTEYESTYDLRNNRLTSQRRDWIEGEWVILQKETMTYDENNNEITYTAEQNFGDGLKPTFRLLNEYTENNLLSVSTTELWDNNTSDFLKETRDLYTYNSNAYLELFVGQAWMEDDWKNAFQTEFEYDSHNNGTLVSFWGWTDEGIKIPVENPVAQILYNNGESFYQYADFYNMIHLLSVSYVNIGEMLSIPWVNPLEKMVRVYPNPTPGKLQIKTQNIDLTEMRLYNQTGLLMGIFPGNNTSVDLTDFAPGIYLLKMKTPKGEVTKKIVKR